ncbi:ABC transporter permease [Synoicihabitans lomoniglobus]|uniref:FtsX-like permease family protein n=1 Tax=Synoicihabitans lomoniglobus TaxID=2909285 RepID=A0AAF0CQ49_9BACT|nr:FtsX-like permease family protein [Opitutaceae bacterium LMO-M01]WED66011.1 FtsX-like permease family protein [Opitutaceae bacterium LMO-M01]
MTLPFIVLRSLRQHLLSTVVTATAIALAGGLLLSVWAIKDQTRTTFTQANSGFDAVLGARGSKLQLVLSSIFHLEASVGNVTAADFAAIQRHRAVKRAIPIAMGDNLDGFRLVGTTPELFTAVEYRPGQTHQLQAGRIWSGDASEAVLGSFAADRLDLKIGDTFHPFHGLAFSEAHEHEDEYTVVGILAPSNTPTDKVVWIPLHGIQHMSGHNPAAADEISAVLIQLRSPSAGFMLDTLFNRQGEHLTFAYPIAAIVADLFGKIGWFDRVLALVAYLVAVVSAAGVLVAIYNSLSARRRDLAILRALGAGRGTLFGSVILEAAALGGFGMVGGFGVYAAITAVTATIIREETGVVMRTWTYHPVMLWAPLGMILLCALGGVIPAVKAYATNVADNLSPQS